MDHSGSKGNTSQAKMWSSLSNRNKASHEALPQPSLRSQYQKFMEKKSKPKTRFSKPRGSQVQNFRYEKLIKNVKAPNNSFSNESIGRECSRSFDFCSAKGKTKGKIGRSLKEITGWKEECSGEMGKGSFVYDDSNCNPRKKIIVPGAVKKNFGKKKRSVVVKGKKMHSAKVSPGSSSYSHLESPYMSFKKPKSVLRMRRNRHKNLKVKIK